MEEILCDLSKKEGADFDLRFAVLTFGKNCVWQTGDSLKKFDGNWPCLMIDEAEDITRFNTACRELKEKLSWKHGFFNFAAVKTITPPVIVLLTDGFANDGDTDGKDGIEELKKNKYFNGSYKLAIAIGDDANQQLCINFTGDKELVFTAYNEKALRGLLDAVINVESIMIEESGYYVDGAYTNYDEKINICKCQYGKTSPNDALDVIYEIEYNLNPQNSI